ncbi:MAG: PLP-dependent aminotransferase family protein [Deltaproteobacteria bacterium]|nr:PLP-dependent aminotransferase family protein [Deltaproteobacteria bacterium]MBW2678072.1 PLP-dependent aminotransferase family protein [Deltaproteobacteria bacterium]
MPKLKITQASVPEGVIDLGVGQPQVDLLPLKILKTAAEYQFHQADANILQYGMQQGDANLRCVLANFLGQEYGVPVDQGSLLITAGVSQALDLICSLMTRPGDTIIVEEPSYFLALRIFGDHHLNIVGTPMDEYGLIISALEDNIKKFNPKLVYTMPVFHNPTGVTLPADRRADLARLSERHDFLVVADEVYQLLAYTNEPPPPMTTFDTAGHVISLGSFSKILAPGLRLGWMHAHREVLEPFLMCGLLDSGGGLNPFNSSIVSSAIELGLQKENLLHLKDVYRTRRDILSRALRAQIPVLDFRVPDGGFFIWARFKDETEAAAVLASAVRYDVGFQPGSRFSSMNGLNTYLRFCFTYYDSGDLVEGVQRLARAMDAAG